MGLNACRTVTGAFQPLDIEELVAVYLGELELPHQPLPADPDWLLVELPGDIAAVMQVVPTSDGSSVLDIRCPLREDVLAAS